MQLDDQTDTQTSSTLTTTDAPASTGTAPVAPVADGDADTSLLGSATSGDGSPAGEGGTEGDKPALSASGTVPETYELKLTVKNEAGEDVATDLDPVLVEAATPLLKEAGLTTEQANKLMPLVPQVQEQLIKQQNDDFAKVRSEWAKEAKADPEIGGQNLAESMRLSAKALDHFTGPNDDKNEFRKLLTETGLGNHPVMIRAFRKIGAALSEDNSFVRNTTEQTVQKSREERMYPNDVPKV